MITIKTEKRFTTSDGAKHDTLRDAKMHELERLFAAERDIAPSGAREAAILCVQLAERVLDVLTTRESSLPTARKINGGTKRRGKRVEAEQAPLPLEPTTTTTASA